MYERPYEKLVVWQESYALHLWIYSLTTKFPMEEKFSLVKQMRRSAYSVPMNIAEGNARRSAKDKAHFLENAISSLEELHYQATLAHALGYISTLELESADDRVQRTGYLLMKLRSSIL